MTKDLWDDTHLWSMEQAIDLVKKLDPAIRLVGFTVGITGGVIIKGYSDKDLDLIIYPMNVTEYSTSAVKKVFIEQFKWKLKFPTHILLKSWEDRKIQPNNGGTDFKHVEVWETEDHKRIDIMFLK